MLAFYALISAFLASAVVSRLASRRFRERVHRDASRLLRGWAGPRRIERGRIESLPAPARRYLERALGTRPCGVANAHLVHTGRLRPTLSGAWLPIRGEEYFSSDPPGFVWWGRARVVPGVWVDARDRSLAGSGNMYVTLQSLLKLADAKGPELDQGALLRLLAEMVWFPSVLADARYVSWTAIDDRTARATLAVNGREVSAIFEFADDGLPVRISAERFRSVGSESVLTPWFVCCGDYREVDGFLIPHRVESIWVIEGRELPVLEFLVERLEYDVAAPAAQGQAALARLTSSTFHELTVKTPVLPIKKP